MSQDQLYSSQLKYTIHEISNLRSLVSKYQQRNVAICWSSLISSEVVVTLLACALWTFTPRVPSEILTHTIFRAGLIYSQQDKMFVHKESITSNILNRTLIGTAELHPNIHYPKEHVSGSLLILIRSRQQLFH